MTQIKDLGTEKTIPDDDDIIPIQQADGITRHITKYNFFQGTSSDVSSLPNYFLHWHDESIIVSGASIRSDIVTSYLYGVEIYQDPAAINDAFKFYRTLQAGNYRIGILTAIKSNLGKLKLEINGDLAFDDLDCYSATSQLNTYLYRDATIASSGLQEFKFTVYTKNASASNYYFSGRKFWGYKL